MTSLLILLGYCSFFFVVLFLMRRRFGMMALAAVLACYLLSMWSFAITAMLSGVSVSTYGVSKLLLVYALVVVFACGVVLPYGQKLFSKSARVLHAVFGAFTITMCTLYAAPQVVTLTDVGIAPLVKSAPMVLSGLLILALIDLLVYKKHSHHA